jgi:hypothetical protein
MFDINEEYSHMPWATDSFGEKLQLCCLKRNGVWKVHYYDNGVWKKLATGTPDDATECCPTSYYDVMGNHWVISFIAGGSTANNWANVGFMLYVKYGIEDDASVAQVCPADTGYVTKGQIVFATKFGPIYNYLEDDKTIITLRSFMKYIYRVSYNPDDPAQILVSGLTTKDKVISMIIDIYKNEAYLLTDNDEPCYKCCIFNKEVYYCKKRDDGQFEERKIVKAENLKKTKVKLDVIVKSIETMKNEFAEVAETDEDF